MVSENVTIQHEVGLHARPAALFVQTAQKFASKITVSYNEKTVNAKSILGLLSLGALTGAEISIQAEGEDSSTALAALCNLVNTNFKD
jgi:phosphotransferase system HPr (HPr) family protein